MPNRLSTRNFRAIPNQIAAAGGTVRAELEARTSEAAATATIRYAVASGFPYRVSSGGSASPNVTTTESTVGQNLTITRTSATPVSFFQLEMIASVPGDVQQRRSCFVWIDQPLGEHIRAFRQEQGMSRADLADRLGVSTSEITQIEQGRFPSLELERAIAEELRNA